MRVHHLNCGSMALVEPPASHRHLTPLPGVNHCLLLETDRDGLVLVETGFGTRDVAEPEHTLGADFLAWAQPRLDIGETAVRQVERLGFSPADVRHIVLTHLHRDHTGGLADFPDARVHVHRAERAAAVAPRYPHQAHWTHGPRWVEYAGDDGERWQGFDNVRPLTGLDAELLVVPMGGHTPGHLAVAVHGDDGWLLHAGDTYYFHGELHPTAQNDTGEARQTDTGEALGNETGEHPMLAVLQARVETDRELRLSNVRRLRALAADDHSGVRVVSAHDPWEYAALTAIR